MSGDGFHVHGPHDHEIEHAVHGGHHDEGDNKKMTNQIAMFTAVIATVGAIFSYMGGATQAAAGLYKNEAAILKTAASNQWNYFQAKSTKQALAEFARDIGPADRREDYQKKVDRYEDEKKDIKKEAEKLEAESKHADELSEAQMHQHHRWAQATTALQVSIALAAIALLTKKKWLQVGMAAVGLLGAGVGVAAFLHV